MKVFNSSALRGASKEAAKYLDELKQKIKAIQMVSDAPSAKIKADKVILNVTADKGGSLRFKGGSMDFEDVVPSTQYIEIVNSGGSVEVRARFRPTKIKKWQIVEAMMDGDHIQDRVNAVARLFDVTEEE